jgi:hypothetical protein
LPKKRLPGYLFFSQDRGDTTVKKAAHFLILFVATLLSMVTMAPGNCLAATIGGNGEPVQFDDGTDTGDLLWIPIIFMDGKAILGPFNSQDTIYFALDFNQNYTIGPGDLFSFNSDDATFSPLIKNNPGFVEIRWRDSPFYKIQALPVGKTIEVLYWTYGCPLDLYYGVEKSPEVVPIPASIYLLGSGLIGLIGFRMKRKL